MNNIDLTPLYRNSIGFDRIASMLDHALSSDSVAPGYPPYNIEVLEDNRYGITLAVAGFELNEINLQVEKGVLTIKGKKTADEKKRYLHQGIANRAFERKFNLADYVEVTGAELNNGLLTINLKKEIPEAMKPRTIEIHQAGQTIEHNLKKEDTKAA